MATAQEVLNIARREIGYSRWNDPQTGTKYGRWYAQLVGSSYYGANGVPYCAMFVSWCMNQAKATAAGVPGAYCPTMLQQARNAGAALGNVRNAQPGDIVYFDWDGGVVDHVGFIEYNHGSYVTCIEGNTDNGIVARKTRYWGSIRGVVRPNYSSGTAKPPVTTPTNTPKPAPAPSKPNTGAKLDVDGEWGRETTKALQRYLGTGVDGIVSQQYLAYKYQNPGLLSQSWEWVSNPRGGSDMIRALQRKLGCTADGYVGPATISALQRKLGTGVDGRIDNPSPCVKALQRALNNNNF